MTQEFPDNNVSVGGPSPSDDNFSEYFFSVTQQCPRKGLDRLHGNATAQAFGGGHEVGSARVPPQEETMRRLKSAQISNYLRAF